MPKGGVLCLLLRPTAQLPADGMCTYIYTRMGGKEICPKDVDDEKRKYVLIVDMSSRHTLHSTVCDSIGTLTDTYACLLLV